MHGRSPIEPFRKDAAADGNPLAAGALEAHGSPGHGGCRIIDTRAWDARRRGSSMYRREHGFTLIELMVVVVIIGILAAIAIPNFISMQDRAKEGTVKSNMHTLQLAAEDYAVLNDGVYCNDAEGAGAAGLGIKLLGNYKNPFLGTTGPADAFEDRT